MALFSFLVSCPSLQSQKPPLICHYFKALWVFPGWEPENLKPLSSTRRGMLGCLISAIGWGLGQGNAHHKCSDTHTEGSKLWVFLPKCVCTAPSQVTLVDGDPQSRTEQQDVNTVPVTTSQDGGQHPWESRQAGLGWTPCPSPRPCAVRGEAAGGIRARPEAGRERSASAELHLGVRARLASAPLGVGVTTGSRAQENQRMVPSGSTGCSG